MPVSSVTDHCIKPDALRINLNHFGDPDYLQVSLLAGATIIAFKQNIIDYNAAFKYRSWPIEAANTYLEFPEENHVYARLTRSEINSRALIIYDPKLRDIEGRELSYVRNEETGTTEEIYGEANNSYYFIYLGTLSAAIDELGKPVERYWKEPYRSGMLDTNQERNEVLAAFDKMFSPHYENPSDPSELTWIEAKGHLGVRGGVTIYAQGDNVDIPTIAEGLPFDQTTIWYNPETNRIEVIGGTGGGGEGGGSIETIEPLTIKDSSGKEKVVYDGSLAKEITLTKNWVGLGNVDNTPDSEKSVAYAGSLKNGKNTVYATWGMIGTDPYNRFGRGGEETWIEGENIEFYVGLYGGAVSVFKICYDRSVRVYDKMAVGKATAPNATLDVEGDAIISEDLTIGDVKISKVGDKALKFDGDLIVTGGMTTYGNEGTYTPSTIMDAIMYDDTTLGINSKGELYVKGGGTGGGTADSVAWRDVSGKPLWITDDKPVYSYSEIEGTPDLSGYATESWVSDKGYALGGDLASLTEIVNGKANKSTTLSGYGITDAYTKTKVDELLDNYAALNEDQTIEGKTDFTGGLLVNGGEIKYDKENGCWKLEGDLLVTGGVTSYAENDAGVSNEVLQSLLDRISTLESEVERLKNK